MCSGSSLVNIEILLMWLAPFRRLWARSGSLLASLVVVSVTLLSAAQPYAAHADESLKDTACRSVHLGYDAPPSTAFYCEAIVDQTAPGTYFCVIGFRQGYFGIQELGDGKKVAIFSVWDPGSQDDPRSVDQDKRVQVLHAGEGVRVSRFGGEGTGGKSMTDFDWKVGEKLRFMVKAEPKEDRVAYSGYLYLPQESKWKHLVTFATLSSAHLIRGQYSFVEDFRRNGESAKQVRTARFGNAWSLTEEKKWVPITSAKFTGDSNPVMNIDAGPAAELFFLKTGGDTTNKTIPLWKKIDREVAPATEPPSDLPL